MAIPPFPSQDLAKLVLGYLAEEQLMTVYDEFLQASPYLDAFRNEFDRIFMTSLKNIMAEFRAVKIYLDTCKPYALRKKIFQCTNLLDVVKFLVTNVDINKIQLQEATERSCIEKQKATTPPKPNECKMCHSKLASCTCKSSQTSEDPQTESMSASHVEASTLQNSVETTPLADLPGNHVTTRKKHMKVLEKDSNISLNVANLRSVQNSDSSAKQSFSSTISPEEYLANCQSPEKHDSATVSEDLMGKTSDAVESRQNLVEFDNVLKSVVNKNKTLSGSDCHPNELVSNASTFKDFTSGILCGKSQSATYNVPDSRTSENIQLRKPLGSDNYNDNKSPTTPHQVKLEVSQDNGNIKIQTRMTGTFTPSMPYVPPKLSKIEPKPADSKVKILSDVTVGTSFGDKDNGFKKKRSESNHMTSTPLMPMQTIMIDGTRAYKHTPSSTLYTKDEIMAMPTVIVVPASGSTQTSVHCEPNVAQSSDMSSKTLSMPRVLGPLVIDVQPCLPSLGEQSQKNSDLVKTVDIKNASVPKDNVISLESSTPSVLPPTRKSSSTPRRTSHVRVLDFATPRRILHETINEQVPSQSSDPPLEIILSGSPNVISNHITTSDIVVSNLEIPNTVNVEGSKNDNESAKENNKLKRSRKTNWDADLRALIANEESVNDSNKKPHKSKSSRKKKLTDKSTTESNANESNNKQSQKKTRTRRKSPKSKKTNRKHIEETEECPTYLEKTSDIPVKPIVNIIHGDYHESIEIKEVKNIETVKNKSIEKEDADIDTPEAERLSLQNVIGSKLNLSDFLETPYKQAIYDIQMGTPRFLGPDLPDEPVSDIKIMNIPTPRFLNTPKVMQATPSSYSSRPTDYSSGGSYYKPDDQDYMPMPDLTVYPVTSSKEDLSIEMSTEKNRDKKKSRPVRQCTKNVSYYKSSGITNKADKTDDSIDSCTIDVNNDNIDLECENKTETVTKPSRQKSLHKKENKRSSSSRNKKSPKDPIIKEKNNSFMKIKPRYTPRKDTPRNRKKFIQSTKGSPSPRQRKRTTSKDKLVNNPTTIVAQPTKSRRKSSTPRKLHCTKTFHSESSGHNSPEIVVEVNNKLNVDKTISTIQDSDNEQVALRWSDDGSQDAKISDDCASTPANDVENIAKIQEFIKLSDLNKTDSSNTPSLPKHSKNGIHEETEESFKLLMKRGFDLETAKSLERDFLDNTHIEPTHTRNIPITVEIVENKKDSAPDKVGETGNSITNDLQIVDDDEDEVEFSILECNEESKNYFIFEYDDTKEQAPLCQEPPWKLKENYTMEICIDDVTMRLKAIPFSLGIDQDPLTVDEIDYSYKETEQAVESISNMSKLYTPLKNDVKAQCYEIFDSTLTSLDTPLKVKSPVQSVCEKSVTELVLGENESKEKTDTKKRKRQSVSDESSNSKRTKPDADLLLKTANIQNIDIETVLTKLHGH